LQLRREGDLPLEPLYVYTGAELGREHLDHNRAVEPDFLG